MRSNKIVLNGDLNVRHVAGDAIAACAVCRVMGVIRNGALQTRGVVLVVTSEAESVSLLDQIGLVLVAVNLVAVEAADLPVIHVALYEIITLHSVLVSRKVRKLIEVCGAWLQFLELPVISEPLSR